MRSLTTSMALLTGISTLVLTACDPAGAPADGADVHGTNAVPLPMPRAIAGSRTIDRDRLSVLLSVGGERVENVRRSGDGWIGTFELIRDGDFPLFVRWSYDVGERTIVLAESPEQMISRSDPGRRITITEYDTSFDFDRDGFGNLAEVDGGTDPLAALVPGEGQGDCRLTRLDGIADTDQDAPRGSIALSTIAEREVAAALVDGQRAYFLDLYLDVAGTLTVEHVGGEPPSTDAFVYDRRASATTDSGSSNVTFGSDFDDELPAVVSATLERGLYCYVIGPGTGTSPFVDLGNLVLRVAFDPR